MCKYSKYLEPWWTFSPLFIDGSLSNPVVVLGGFPNEEAETRSDSVMFGHSRFVLIVTQRPQDTQSVSHSYALLTGTFAWPTAAQVPLMVLIVW